MDIIKVIGFGIFATILCVILKEERKEFALLIAIIAGISILIFTMTKMSQVLDMLYNLTEKSGINSDFLVILLKVIGIAYIVEFGKNICIDSGQSAIATKLEIAGKVSVVVISLPIFSSLISLITNLV